MMSTVWLFSAAIFAVGPTLTKPTESGASPAALAKAGHITREASPGGLPILWPAKSLTPVHAVALQPIEGLAGVGIDAHHRNGVGALALGHQLGGELGD